MQNGIEPVLIRVAAVQPDLVYRDAPRYFDFLVTLEKTLALIAEAGGKDAGLMVFSENWLPCFFNWSMDYAYRAGSADMQAKLP